MSEWTWLEKTGWMADAACRNKSTDIFFDEDRLPEAQAICGACEVFEECKEFAFSQFLLEDESGVYAGMLPVQRRSYLRRARKQREKDRGIKSDV